MIELTQKYFFLSMEANKTTVCVLLIVHVFLTVEEIEIEVLTAVFFLQNNRY